MSNSLWPHELQPASVHGILQAPVLEWVAISTSRGSSWLRNWTQISYIAGRHFTIWAIREAWNNRQVPNGKWISQGCMFSSCLWMKHILESRLLGEISIASDIQMTPPSWQKVKMNQEPLDESETEWKSWFKILHSKNEDAGIPSHHFMTNSWETMETVWDFIYRGSRITADGDWSHEIKRWLLLGRKIWPTQKAY